ncbi:sensor histidine kinase [Streptomyces sp. GMY02]|uniref:sensor histidine kinase n=1 Tax=Streptomyces sp. GMY02 TaxID=1333528 RepID=UPI0020B70A9A|nr:histidine kinase [Streptomyces sp. GMY02]
MLIAAGGLLGGLVLWFVGLHTIQDTRPLAGAWVLLPMTVMAGLEALRRATPRLTVLIGTLALVADQFTTGSLATVVMFTDLMYAAVLYGTPAAARRIPWTTALITITVTIGLAAWLHDVAALLLGVVTGLLSFAPATTGAVVRNHRDAAEAARLRAEQTALLAEIDRGQAVRAERARMARELHDMVANHLSAIAIHSTAALSLGDERTTRDALSVIRENSVEGLAEMRRLIGLLRDGSGDGEPTAAPTLRALDTLLEQARTNGASSGLSFTLDDRREGRPYDRHTGRQHSHQEPRDDQDRQDRHERQDRQEDPAADPHGRTPGLPAPVELAAYRIVQESLTNALKHAAPGTVTVELARTKRALTVCVSSPFGQAPGPRAPGSGAGLVGMRERVALLDGVFEAGPAAPGDGTGRIWRVRAELPVTEGSAAA